MGTEMHDFFATSAQVSGTLLGLLFVAISLRYDLIMGSAANRKNRWVAARGFTGLLNALTVSMLALVPDMNLGLAAIIMGALCLLQVLRRGISAADLTVQGVSTLAISVVSFGTQVVAGAYYLFDGSRTAAEIIAYTLFGSIAAGVLRSWALLQPDDEVETGTEE